MINVGKYMAAARGGRNVASDIAPSVAKSIPVEHTKLIPNMAGYEGGRSAYIQMDGAGYGRRAKHYPSFNPAAMKYSSGNRILGRGSNYSKPDYSRVTGDQDLSRLL